MTTTTFQVPDGYNRNKKPRLVTVRPMTEAEIRALAAGSSVHFVSMRGELRIAKVNGRVRTWKRDSSRVEVPLKYGMYEHATLSLMEAMLTLVVVTGE
jgi:hypothetical protein